MSESKEPRNDSEFRRDRARVERRFWPKVRRALGKVPFLEDAVAAYYCAKDPKTPFQVKAIAMGALAYFVMPADLVPDIVAGLGYTDDAAVFLAAWRSIARHVLPEHREQAKLAVARLRAEGGGES